MSRLTDADELKKAFIGNRYGTKAIEYVIDNAPTVKAIPIEWLESQLNVFGDGFYDLRLVIKQWEKDNEGKTN